MRAGKLDRRIQILVLSESQESERGELIPAWLPAFTTWAGLVPGSTAERVLGREVVSEGTTVWSVRYRTDIDATMRLRYENEDYRITGVMTAPQRKRELFITTVKEDPERSTA